MKVEEKAAGNKAGGIAIGTGLSRNQRTDTDLYFDRVRFFRAALAPFLPRAVCVLLGKCAIVLFRRATLEAFLMFRFAAARCFLVVTFQRRRLRVRAAFFAAADRDRAERRLATRFACLDKAFFDADRRLSRLSARLVARERFAEGFLRRAVRPFARSRLA